ncbi:hypothetical protein BDZ94DRAFT_1159321 [Collybia nuda]|uniref:Uncharacterized protein n=1 Tax=Collybia nuda TaxID=64659 RepID=A0A9P5Y9F2_9AGAR|nr:hypothetical protein BDZ94DRAFT_1159321 [Collybia nuda]
MPLSPELYGRIASFAQTRPADLVALCLTCKAFQREAEIRLYENLVFVEPQSLHLACESIIQNERLGLHVRRFLFSHEMRRPPPLGQPLWESVKGALNCMHNLENLLLQDTTYSNTWIFDPAEIKFQLREAKLRFVWDARMMNFLQSQRELRLLNISDNLADLTRPKLKPGSLPLLQIFDGMIITAIQMFSCPLTHLQMRITGDSKRHVPFLLSKLFKVHKTLRSLSILHLQDDQALDAVSAISAASLTIQHLGLIPLPITNRHEFYHYLLRLHHLRTIQVDLAHWVPQPHVMPQRAIAAEIKMYCPSIYCVVFWVHNTKFRWEYSQNEWRYHLDTQHYPQNDQTWYLG